jgi:hypothetical protein
VSVFLQKRDEVVLDEKAAMVDTKSDAQESAGLWAGPRSNGERDLGQVGA